MCASLGRPFRAVNGFMALVTGASAPSVVGGPVGAMLLCIKGQLVYSPYYI